MKARSREPSVVADLAVWGIFKTGFKPHPDAAWLSFPEKYVFRGER